ncbi:MAG: hypothetical protein CFE31_11045 [Rhizobiales bacterium PAR1]|nr:MAG: hypothetical protein CFE31_11045 [Rhizobiales bacterium PAR1]
MRLSKTALLQLMATLVAVFVVTSAIMTALAYRTAALYTQDQIRAIIVADLGGLADLWQRLGPTGLQAAIEARQQAPEPRRLYLLVSGDGDKITGDFDFWPNNLAKDRDWTHFEHDGEGYDGLSTHFADGSRLMIAHHRSVHEAMLRGLSADLIGPALLGLLAAGLASLVILRKLFRRIDRINETCRAVASGDLAARVPLDARIDEFRELASNVNMMLDRIDVLMRGVRTLSDSLAHEMRTPIAHLRAGLDRAAREIETAPQDQQGRDKVAAALTDGVREADGVITLFTALLDIAATEAAEGSPNNLVLLDMADLVHQAVNLYEGVAEDRGIHLVIAAEPAPILGEEHLLVRFLANLLDNALKFSPPGKAVSITCGSADLQGFLILSDQGPGMPEAFRDKAFERFARSADAKATPGHGLGLSLVRAIARRHSIAISLYDGAPGLRVEARWPLP